jgi:hypothetical protein
MEAEGRAESMLAPSRNRNGCISFSGHYWPRNAAPHRGEGHGTSIAKAVRNEKIQARSLCSDLFSHSLSRQLRYPAASHQHHLEFSDEPRQQ